MATKKNIKVRDLKPRKDAKGGVGTNVGTNVGINAGVNASITNTKNQNLDGPQGTR